MVDPEELTECKKSGEKGKENSLDELPAVDEMELTKELILAKSRFNDLPIPDELDVYIQKGLARGIKVRKSRYRQWSALVACLLVVLFITTIRVSPVVAAALQQIPGLSYIVELINYDKGLQSAVSNDFFQPLGVSDEHEKVVFTVDGIIMDESSLVLFYTVENKRDQGLVDLSDAKFFDENGEPLKDISASFGNSANPDQDGDGKVHSQINVNFSDLTVIPDNISVKVKLHEVINGQPPVSDNAQSSEIDNALSPTWEVTIPVDRNKYAGMKKVYQINQSVVIEGQKITFAKATVYPTRTALNVSFDPANSKKILAFDDLALVNEKGEEWGRIMNGVIGSIPDENHQTLFFQSNYFTQPKELFLCGKSIRALNKEDLSFTLDLEKERIIKAPPGLELDKIVRTPSGKATELDLLVKTNPEYDKQRGFSIFSFGFTDANGKTFDTSTCSVLSSSEKSGFDETFVIALPDNITYQSPITFQIEDYPSRITGVFDIRIK